MWPPRAGEFFYFRFLCAEWTEQSAGSGLHPQHRRQTLHLHVIRKWYSFLRVFSQVLSNEQVGRGVVLPRPFSWEAERSHGNFFVSGVALIDLTRLGRSQGLSRRIVVFVLSKERGSCLNLTNMEVQRHFQTSRATMRVVALPSFQFWIEKWQKREFVSSN